MISLFLSAGLSSVAADAPEPTDATTPAAAAPLRQVDLMVTVLSVSGRAHKSVIEGDRARWVSLKAGEKLPAQTVIRTGFRSRVVLQFADRGEMTINNATKMGIGEFRKQGNRVKTRLGLKYGTVRASVDSSRGPNDWQVSTPTATLSVRGSESLLGWLVDVGTNLQALKGNWKFLAGLDVIHVVQGGESTDGNMAKYYELLKKLRELQLLDTFGLSGAERDRTQFFGSGRGLSTFGTGGTTGPRTGGGTSNDYSGNDGGRDEGSP